MDELLFSPEADEALLVEEGDILIEAPAEAAIETDAGSPGPPGPPAQWSTVEW